MNYLPRLFLLPLFLAFGLCAGAQDNLDEDKRLNGKEVLEKFESAKKVMDSSVVDVLNGNGDLLAFGTIVSKNQVLTKASMLIAEEGIQFKMPDGKTVTPKRVDRLANNDLALFEIPDGDLTPVTFIPAKDFKQGAWLVARSMKEPGIMVGVKAASNRGIKKQRGVIGVILGADGDEVGGVIVNDVDRDGGASAAGIRKGDIITSIEGIVITKRADLVKQIGKHEPGKLLKVKISRDEVEIDKEVRLGHREHVFAQFNRIAKISGPTSKRKSGFDDIIQHDIPLSISEMGGPMLNVKGECIGINISRINRSENFALPTEVVQHFLTTTDPEPPAIVAAPPEKPEPPPSVVTTPKKPTTPVPEPTPEEAVVDPMTDLDGNEVEPYELVE